MDRGARQATVHGAARVGLDSVTKPPPLPQEHHDLTSRTKTLTPEVPGHSLSVPRKVLC